MGKSKLLFATALLALLPATGSLGQWYGQSESQTKMRTQHAPELAVFLKRFLTPEGFMDPEFPPTVAKPSAYLSDFFGLQAIQDISREQILSDFVPTLAKVVATDTDSVTLEFTDGFTARFYPVSSLVAAGVSTPISHVEVSGSDWRSLRANLAKFETALDRAKLKKRYLIKNPYFSSEQRAYRQMIKGNMAKVLVDPELQQFTKSRAGVLILGEAQHGAPDDVEKAIRIVQAQRIDWIGLEMIDTTRKNEVDAFNRARRGTAAYGAARARLVDYFAEAWNGRAGPKTTGEENLYFKLVEAAHDRGTKVIALEASALPFLFFRFGETNFGGGVRSMWWADQLPRSGRGIVFGGSAHMNDALPMNVQDFIQARDHKRPIFALRSYTKKAAQN